MATNDVPKRRIKTTDTIFDVIDAVQRLDEPTVQNVADFLDLANSTVHAHLASLVYKKYVVKDGETYRLGLRFLDHGIHSKRQKPIARPAQPILDNLAQETSELVWLYVKEYGRTVTLLKAEGERAVTTANRVGKMMPLHRTAGGKAILAHLSEGEAERILGEYGLPGVTSNTITSREVLFDELRTIEERGFALNDEESIEGIRAVASAIVVDDQVLGSITVPGPKYRFVGTHFRETLPNLVMSATNEIQLELTNFDV